MTEWIRPLFAYKKFINARRVLKYICKPQINLTERKNGESVPAFIPGFNKMNLALILSELPITIDPLRLSEAVDLLFQNGHILRFEDIDWIKYEIVCTKKGEAALNDGYYTKKIYLFWIAVIGTPTSLIGLLSILKVIRL